LILFRHARDGRPRRGAQQVFRVRSPFGTEVKRPGYFRSQWIYIRG
jgi:hypothetical protein